MTELFQSHYQRLLSVKENITFKVLIDYVKFNATRSAMFSIIVPLTYYVNYKIVTILIIIFTSINIIVTLHQLLVF
jgi:hypothetical protein